MSDRLWLEEMVSAIKAWNTNEPIEVVIAQPPHDLVFVRFTKLHQSYYLLIKPNGPGVVNLKWADDKEGPTVANAPQTVLEEIKTMLLKKLDEDHKKLKKSFCLI